MKEKKQTTKYLLPVAVLMMLVIFLVFCILFMRTSLMKLTVEERSNQLEEMVTQIQANLDSGLQTHWNLVAGLTSAVQGTNFKNSQDVSDNILHLENDFRTDLYGCRVMLLDEQGTAYLSDGPAGIWYDLSHLLDGKKQHTFVSETDTIDGCFLVFSQELDSRVTMGDQHVRFTHIVLLKDIQTSIIPPQLTAAMRQPISSETTEHWPILMRTMMMSLVSEIFIRYWKKQSMCRGGVLT